MFKKLVLKIFFAEIIFFSFILSVNSQDTYQYSYLSFNKVIDQLELKNAVQFGYIPEWFENKTIPLSILMFTFDEVADRIKAAARLSLITIDSVLYIFALLMPKQNLKKLIKYFD